VETPDSLILTNVGNFLPGSVETVIQQDAPLEIYRNPFLAEAMVNLNLIDTQGGGIKKMFLKQRSRFFPLPTYDLSQPERVVVRLAGRILDERYARILMHRTDLNLEAIILLDRVQKRFSLDKEEHQCLKRLGLVEGRYPNLVVAAEIAAATGDKARHIRDKGLDNRYYQEMILELIRTHQPVTREDVDAVLLDKLPEVLSHEQKLTKIHNLMMSLAHRLRKIRNTGTRGAPRWTLISDSIEQINKENKGTKTKE
jgi:ATP-dependent DNA helicase RecG